MPHRWWYRWVGSIVALLLGVLAGGRGRSQSNRASRMEFSSSAQRMGVRFGERVRQVWRHRWLRLRR